MENRCLLNESNIGRGRQRATDKLGGLELNPQPSRRVGKSGRLTERGFEPKPSNKSFTGIKKVDFTASVLETHTRNKVSLVGQDS